VAAPVIRLYLAKIAARSGSGHQHRDDADDHAAD